MHCSLWLECEIEELKQTVIGDVTDSFGDLHYNMTSSFLDKLNFLSCHRKCRHCRTLTDCVGISVPFEALLDDGSQEFVEPIVELFISFYRKFWWMLPSEIWNPSEVVQNYSLKHFMITYDYRVCNHWSKRVSVCFLGPGVIMEILR